MSITDKKGINITSGFKLVSGQPIDARMVVDDENELVSLVDNGAAYEGQLVYVKSLDKYVSFDGSQFNELETGGGGAEAYVEGTALVINNSGTPGTGGSGGKGTSFVEVNELPKNPTTNTIYKLKKPVAFVVLNGIRINIVYFLKSIFGREFSYKVVDTLPTDVSEWVPGIIYMHNKYFYTVLSGTIVDGETLVSVFGGKYKGYIDTLENLEEMGIYVYDNVESYNIYDGKYNTFPTKKYKKILEVSKTFDSIPGNVQDTYTYEFNDTLGEKEIGILQSYATQKLNFKAILKFAISGLDIELILNSISYFSGMPGDGSIGCAVFLSGRVYAILGFATADLSIVKLIEGGIQFSICLNTPIINIDENVSLELYVEDDI